LSPKEFGGPLPNSLTLYTKMPRELARQWTVVEPRGYVGDPKADQKMRLHPSLLEDRNPDEPEQVVLLTELDPQTTYSLRFHLEPRSVGNLDADALREILDKEKLFQVVIRSK